MRVINSIIFKCSVCRKTHNSEAQARHCAKNHEYMFYQRLNKIQELGVEVKMTESSIGDTCVQIGNMKFTVELLNYLDFTKIMEGYCYALEYMNNKDTP